MCGDSTPDALSAKASCSGYRREVVRAAAFDPDETSASLILRSQSCRLERPPVRPFDAPGRIKTRSSTPRAQRVTARSDPESSQIDKQSSAEIGHEATLHGMKRSDSTVTFAACWSRSAK